MKSYNKADYFLIFTILAVFLSATWLLIRPDSSTSNGVHTQQVGTITYKNHFAERKVSGEVIWGGLEQSAPVYNNDTVRTTTDSSAVIFLQDKTEISLGEKTMVLVSMASQGTNIKIAGGLVSVRQNEQASGGGSKRVQPVTMTTDAGTVSMTSGSVSISDTGGKIAVNVETGSVKVSSGDSIQDVGENSVVDLSGSKPITMDLVPISPQSGQILFLTETTPTVSVKWKTGPVLNPGKPLGQLIVAADSEFKHIEYQGKIVGSNADIALPEGTHYWKLNSDGMETPPRWFNTLIQRPPLVHEPAENQNFSYEATLPLIRFSWRPLPFAMSYRLEIYNESALTTPFLAKTTALANLAIDSLKEGAYQYRIVAISGQNAAEFASQATHFTIKNTKMAAPVITAAAESEGAAAIATTISTVASGNGKALTAWKSVEGADQYLAVVSRDSSGTDIVASMYTTSNSLRLAKPLDQGTYYVRVSAISGTAKSAASKPIVIQIVEPYPIKILLPAMDATLDPGEAQTQFRWSDPNKGSKYRLVFSTEPSFAQAFLQIDSLATNSNIALPQDHTGSLWWKVQLLDASDSVVTQSMASTFNLPQLFPDPKTIYPRDGEQIDVNVNAVIRISWEPIRDANEYQIALYRMSGNLKSLIKAWTTDKTWISIEDFTALSTDPYAWNLNARRMAGEKLLGQSRSIMSYFRITQSHPLTIPAVIKFGEEEQQ